jgi:lipopolysaccharide export system protein LptA
MPERAANRIARGALALVRAGALGLAVLGVPAWAVLPGESDEPIHIRADSAELDEREGTVIYRGNVRMTQGEVELLADLVTVLLEDEQVVRITAEGDRARYRQLVGEDRELVTALARTIVYITRDEVVELIGNAHLSQRHNEFAGGLIRYDMRAGRVVAEGEDDEGVQMILQPPRRD